MNMEAAFAKLGIVVRSALDVLLDIFHRMACVAVRFNRFYSLYYLKLPLFFRINQKYQSSWLFTKPKRLLQQNFLMLFLFCACFLILKNKNVNALRVWYYVFNWTRERAVNWKGMFNFIVIKCIWNFLELISVLFVL